MAIGGIGNDNMTNLYNSIFGRSTGSSGALGIDYGEYAMIKSGAYRKLIKSYYKTTGEETSETDTSDTNKKNKVDAESKNALMNTKNQADNLSKSLDALDSRSLYKAAGKDEKGKNVYKTDDIAGAVKSFVDDYNSLIKSTDKLDSRSVVNKTMKMSNITAKNAKLLSKIGIRMNSDFTLSLDEDTLKKADVTTVSSLFQGTGSYGQQVQQAADQSGKLANSLAYNGSKSVSYSFDGNYSVLGTSNSVLNQFM